MLTARQQKLFEAFFDAPNHVRSVGDFQSLGVGRSTLFRDLSKLCAMGLLQLEGKSYRLDESSDAYVRWDLSRPPHLRGSVRYDPKLLATYKPNKTYCLSDAQLKKLEVAGQVTGAKAASTQGKPYARVLNSLLIDLTHASSNLENVAISWLDTKTLIEFGEIPGGLSEKQLRVVLNHKEAIAFIVEHGPSLSVGRRDLLDIHAIVVKGLLGDPSAVGALRSKIVRFDDSRYLPPDNPHQLKDIFREFCDKAAEIGNPHEQAFFTMLFIPYIQPFEDGNKRTSRLAMNIPLVKNGLAPFSFSDISKRDYLFGLLAFYERARHGFLAESFVEAYGRSAARYADLVNFINEGGVLSTLTAQPTGDQGSAAKKRTARKPGKSK